jgi:DNA-binding XRE family transcriptional regulator
MNLRDYMHFNKLTQWQMAQKVLVTPNYIGAIARGERKPSQMLAEMIELKLNGEVTAKEILDYCHQVQYEKSP